MSVLRSVSPIHLDYLRNTARIMRDRGLSRGQILDALERHNLSYGPQQLPRSELLTIVDRSMEAL